MKRFIFSLVFALLIVLPLVNAVDIGESENEGVIILSPLEPSTNFSIQNVNSSDFWDDKDTSLDLTEMANFSADTLEITNRLGIRKAVPGNAFVVVPGSVDDGIVLRESDDGNDAVEILANTVRGFIGLNLNGVRVVEISAGDGFDTWFKTQGGFGIGTAFPLASFNGVGI